MEQLKKKYLFLVNLLTSSSKLLILLLLGLILIGFGVLAYKMDIFSSGDKVEVLYSTNAGPESPQDGQGNIIVEISGSVENPGVYKMKMGDRIDDLLIISGGLSENADRDWVTKNINRASKLVDGQKIYIYQTGETSAKNINGSNQQKEVLGVIGSSTSSLININTSTQKDLEELVGIGPVYAQKIIEGRNYSNIEELVTRKIIPQKTLEKIKNSITI